MKVGISTASLFLKAYNEDAVAILSEWGIPVTEIFLSTYSEYNKDFGKLLNSRKGDMLVNSVHDLTDQLEPQLYAVHERVKADAFGYLKGIMDVAKEVGAKYYTFHGVSRIKRYGNYDNFSFLSPRTHEIAEFCKGFGVTLAYENVEWATYNRPGAFQELKKSCPELSGVLDVKQARISGYDYKEYIKDMGEALAYVHFSDVDENGKTALPGRGIFPVEEMIKALKDAGFNGNILIENYAKDYNELTELKQAYEYLSEKIYKS